MSLPVDTRLLRRGVALEGVTLAWNVVGVVLLAVLALQSRSGALLGFGLDSLIEIGASVVVLWELSGTGVERRRRALRLIAVAFVLLAAYLLVASASAAALLTGHRPDGSIGGIVWTAVTALVMFRLAALKTRVGLALGNEVLRTEGRVTFVDGLLATAVLLGVGADTLLGWWWADAVAGLVIAGYAAREAVHLLRE